MKFTLHKQNNTILFLVWNFLSPQCHSRSVWSHTYQVCPLRWSLLLPLRVHRLLLSLNSGRGSGKISPPPSQTERSEATSLGVLCWHAASFLSPRHTAAGTVTSLEAPGARRTHTYLPTTTPVSRAGLERRCGKGQLNAIDFHISCGFEPFDKLTSLQLYINIFVSLLKEVFISRLAIFLGLRVEVIISMNCFQYLNLCNFAMNIILVEVMTQGILLVHIWLPPPQKGLDTSLPSPVQKSLVLLSSPSTSCPAMCHYWKLVHLLSPLPESQFHELKGPPCSLSCLSPERHSKFLLWLWR